MASFATLPSDDRWALAQFVLSLGPTPEKPAPGDFTSIGIDPNKEGGGETVAKTVSVAFAMQQMAVPEGGKTSMIISGSRMRRIIAGPERRKVRPTSTILRSTDRIAPITPR